MRNIKVVDRNQDKKIGWEINWDQPTQETYQESTGCCRMEPLKEKTIITVTLQNKDRLITIQCLESNATIVTEARKSHVR